MKINIHLPSKLSKKIGISAYSSNPVIKDAFQLADQITALLSPTTASHGSRFIATSNIKGIGPPRGVPLLIPELGLLTLDAPSTADVLHRLGATSGALASKIKVEASMPMRGVALRRPNPGRSRRGFRRFDKKARRSGSRLADDDSGSEIYWNLYAIKVPLAWVNTGLKGEGIRVAFVDSGLTDHIDLPDPVLSQTFVAGGISIADDAWHGTPMAGIVAARENGIGMVGVAPLADLMVAKVLNQDCVGEDNQIAAGIEWAVKNGAHIINLSLGSYGSTQALADSVDYAVNSGVTICAAAGNDGNQQVLYPAAYDSCIAVAATDSKNGPGSFTNYGPEIDICAPGDSGIYTTYLSDSYLSVYGTSPAAAHVSGVAALLLSSGSSFTPAQVKSKLQQGAIPVVGTSSGFGAGLIQADKVLQ